MEEIKRAIILDMDETLERGVFDENSNKIMMLRPNLDKLIEKLKEAKGNGIDIVLCTTAKHPWVERFLELKPEFREIFDRILTRDNEKEWKYFSEEDYPIEYEAKIKDVNIGNGKPVTTFGYDSILFIDDNILEGERLKSLFDMGQEKLASDVTFFTGYGFYPPEVYNIFKYTEAAKRDDELARIIPEYLQTLRDENGCLIMCTAIDDFMQKKYEPGLALVDDRYEEQYKEYKKTADGLSEEIENKMCGLEERLKIDFLDLIYDDAEVKAEFENFYKSDKKYPFEGIELPVIKEGNREKLEALVETAIEKHEKLSDAKKLLEEYKQQSSKEDRTTSEKE